MRVAHIIDNLQLVGGAQRVLILLARAMQANGNFLSELGSRPGKDRFPFAEKPPKLEQVVIDLQEDKESPNIEWLRAAGVEVVHFPGRNMRDLKRFQSLKAYLQQESFDLVHTHLLHANVIGITASRLAGLRVIGSLYNVHEQHRRNHAPRVALETFLLRYATEAVMAVGERTAEAHRKRMGNKKIYAIPTAVEIPAPLTEEERREAREALTGDSSRPLVISVGRLNAQKGYAYLLDGFNLLRKQVPNAALVIAGTGSLMEPLSQQIRTLGLENHAWLLGPRSDIQRLLGACDVFVSSSLWEGLPSALLEAMAAGLPVVATTVGDMPRVVTPQVGSLIPPEDPEAIASKLHDLLLSPERMRSMGSAARKYVHEHHGTEVWSKKILSMYTEAIDQTRQPDRHPFEARHGV